MADVRRKGERAWLVRSREAGKQRYRQFHTEPEAEAFKAEMESRAMARRVLAPHCMVT